jgi:hypothetical protein
LGAAGAVVTAVDTAAADTAGANQFISRMEINALIHS